MSSRDARRPIIIRRKKVIKVQHGSSWKIALADFMTALMALFLVMWVLSTATDEQRSSVAEYFSTPLVNAVRGGDGMSESSNIIPGGGPDPMHTVGERSRVDPRQRTWLSGEQRRFLTDLQRRIESAVEADPELREWRSQMRFTMTPEGLLIQLLDTERRPMFQVGSDQLEPAIRKLLATMAPLINELPNALSISGHTDSLPYAGGYVGYSNWELSTDRANASRRALVSGGFASEKLLRVAGMADQLPLPDMEPGDPMNRRIALLVLTEEAEEQIRDQHAHFTDEPVSTDDPDSSGRPDTDLAASDETDEAEESEEAAESGTEVEVTDIATGESRGEG